MRTVLIGKCIAKLWRQKLRLPSSQNTEHRKVAMRGKQENVWTAQGRSEEKG